MRSTQEIEAQAWRLLNMEEWAIDHDQKDTAYAYQHQRFALLWALDPTMADPVGFAYDIPEASSFQHLGDGVYRVGGAKRSAVTGRYIIEEDG